jgi:transposase
MAKPDDSEKDCTTFDILFQSLESPLAQHEHNHPPYMFSVQTPWAVKSQNASAKISKMALDKVRKCTYTKTMMDTVLSFGNTSPDSKDQRIAELESQLAQAQATIQALGERIQQLEAEVQALQRAGKRQATPFARRKRVAEPKRPGRKAGQGTFAHRPKPEPEQVNETKEEPLSGCPGCGGPLTDLKEHEQFVIDIPPAQPVITRYVTQSGYCSTCQKRIRSHHPEQTSEASGAAGVMVGPRAKALATDLKHRLGASYGKVCQVISDAFGLEVSRSGWCQADQRLANQARPIYEELTAALRACAVVHADETGWRIGVLSAWLWVFTNRQVTVYAIHNRSHEVVVNILGREFKGVLVSDCFLAYDHNALDDWLKQKCIGHLLRNLSELEESKAGDAVRFAQDVTSLLRRALALKAEKPALDADTFAQRAAALEAELDTLIDAGQQLTDPDNARFARRLRKQRPHVLRFLYVEGLEATNNQAERMLRPAVITRKTSGCNRTEDGAEAHSILSSVLVTCHQQAIPILDYLVKLQRFGETPPSLAPPQPAPT